jgi:hypothetical protein
MMAAEQQHVVDAPRKESGLWREARKGLQVAALAAALVPLGSVPITSTDDLIGSPGSALAQEGGGCSGPGCSFTIPVPEGVSCDGGEGAIAVVSGGKAGLPQFRTLLVTSCREDIGSGSPPAPAKLFFTDPVTGANAATITTNAPALPPGGINWSGWESLQLRPDKGDLLACTTLRIQSCVGDCITVNQPALYSIQFNPHTGTPGTTAFLRNGPPDSSCAGISWDPLTISNPNDDQFYQSSSGTNVLHYSSTDATGTAVSTGCFDPEFRGVAGVAVAGNNLFAACTQGDDQSESAVLRRLNKNDASLVQRIPIPAFSSSTSDIECDPGTFGAQNKEVVWAIDQFRNAQALEVPFGSCQPVPPPAACPTGTLDSDGDALLDCWEDASYWSDGLPGITFAGQFVPGGNPANRDVTLCVDANTSGGAAPFGAVGSDERARECAHPKRQDIFVEIDYMQFHRPNADAMLDVQAAYKAAPRPNPAGHPSTATTDWSTGIRLHIQIDEEVPHKSRLAFVPCTTAKLPNDADAIDFDELKTSKFGTAADRNRPNGVAAKRYAYRYSVFGHDQQPKTAGTTNSTSGCSEVLGNDFIVTLGSWAPKVNNHINVGSRDHHAGTFMHELGHILALRHNGEANAPNCNPAYTSVMSYTRQFSTPIVNPPRPLDYAKQPFGFPLATAMGPVIGIKEDALSESAGIGGFAGGWIAVGPPSGLPPKTRAVQIAADGSLSWDADATPGETVSRDVSHSTGTVASPSGGCPTSRPTTPTAVYPRIDGEILASYDDWSNIQFNFRASPDFADGVHFTIDAVDDGAGSSKAEGTLSMTLEEAREISTDFDADGVLDIEDNCPLVNNPDQFDGNADGVGDACEDAVGAGIEVKHGQGINQNQALLHVVLFGTPSVIVTNVDLATAIIRGIPPTGPQWVVRVKTNDDDFDAKIHDVDKDRDLDLELKFDVKPVTPLPLGRTRVVFEARTTTGALVRGESFINVR